MKKYRKCKTRRVKSHNNKTSRKGLRAGSKTVKAILMERNPRCDICGSTKSLTLHHIYLIRHGFKTELDRCCLLCANCHADFHHRFDKLLDKKFRENPNADFRAIYEELKTQ